MFAASVSYSSMPASEHGPAPSPSAPTAVDTAAVHFTGEGEDEDIVAVDGLHLGDGGSDRCAARVCVLGIDGMRGRVEGWWAKLGRDPVL